jgi:hypothetical protein
MSKDYERDYQFGEAAQFDRSFRKLSGTIGDARVKPIASAFQRNIERVIDMNSFPLEMIHWSSLNMRAKCMALASLGRPLDVDSNGPGFDAEFAKARDALNAQLFRTEAPGSAAERAAKSARSFLRKFLLQAAAAIESAPDGQEYIFGGVESILAAMLTTAYAAFGSAAADLWVELVNADPEAPVAWVESNPGRSMNLSFHELAGHGFDLNGKMGSYLHQSRRISLQSLSELRSAYHTALRTLADECFEPSWALYEAEKVCQLFTHRGGIVDQRFKRDMRNYPEYDGINAGSCVELSGLMVSRIVSATVRSGVALLKFADAHLKALAG